MADKEEKNEKLHGKFYGLKFTGNSGECYLGMNKENDGYLCGWNLEILEKNFKKSDWVGHLFVKNPIAVQIEKKKIGDILKNLELVEIDMG